MLEGGELNITSQTVQQLFNSLKGASLLGWKFAVTASFVAIHNEVLFDLLNMEGEDHEIRQANVTNLTQHEVTDADTFDNLMRIARSNRATAATTGNERSRTHNIVQLKIDGKNSTRPEFPRSGCINLVDLAGSETKDTDRSLIALSKFVDALVLKEPVPKINSELTHFLMPSLIDELLIFVNISPLTAHLTESIKSLRFAAKVHADIAYIIANSECKSKKNIELPSIV